MSDRRLDERGGEVGPGMPLGRRRRASRPRTCAPTTRAGRRDRRPRPRPGSRRARAAQAEEGVLTLGGWMAAGIPAICASAALSHASQPMLSQLGAASRRDAVEHGVRARIRGQAEPAEHGRDRAVQHPARRLAAPHRLASGAPTRAASARSGCRSPTARSRRPGRTLPARRWRRRGRRRRSVPNRATASSTAARICASSLQVGGEHQDVVAHRAHRTPAAAGSPALLVEAWDRRRRSSPLLRLRERGPADQHEAGAERLKAASASVCPCGRARR